MRNFHSFPGHTRSPCCPAVGHVEVAVAVEREGIGIIQPDAPGAAVTPNSLTVV